ncbi:MAG TPA: hypothetical protein VN426_02975 [Syntrophomonadaceae bacterium]|nr:hypothetical protein [Syntrophomonadaceae bacterium]
MYARRGKKVGLDRGHVCKISQRSRDFRQRIQPLKTCSRELLSRMLHGVETAI